MQDVPTVAPTIPDFSLWYSAAFHWIAAAWPVFVSVLSHIVGIVVGLSIPLALFFFLGIIYCVEGLKKIRDKEAEIHEAKVEPAFETVETGDTVMAHRWENALKHIDSPNQNDWKQAIIEADILLDDLLTKMGYQGESVGEKLKRVNPGDMKSLNEAWEAHKVRNRIAHDGSGFALTQYEAKQVISNYRKVFEEFYYT